VATADRRDAGQPGSDVLGPLLEDVTAALASISLDVRDAFGERTVVVDADDVVEAMRICREQGFALCCDVTAADFPGTEQRHCVSYHLLDLDRARRLRVQTWAAEGQEVPSVTSVYPAANWHEREVYDLFGVNFVGHPDLRRILMPEDWEGHPLRKDYPIGGEEVRFSNDV
jgi:NADH-quinone oxidoreductase subunit C